MWYYISIKEAVLPKNEVFMKMMAKTALPTPYGKKGGQLKWIILSVVLALVIGGFTVTVLVLNLFGATFREREQTASEARVVMTVGDHEVTYDLYSYLFLNHKATAEEKGETAGLSDKEVFSLVHARVVKDVASLYAALDTVAAVGASETDVDAAVDTLRELTRGGGEFAGNTYEGFDYEWVYDDVLKEKKMTDHVYRLFLRKIAADYVAAEHYDQNAEKHLDISEAAVRSYFYESGDVARVTYAYIAFDSFMGDKTSARTVASVAYTKLIEAADGTMDDYTKIAVQYSPTLQASSVKNGFYVGRYNASEASAALVEAVFSLSVGEIAEPIETEDGIYIVRRLGESYAYIDNPENFDSLYKTYVSNSFYQEVSAREEALVASAAFTEAFKDVTAEDIVFPAE